MPVITKIRENVEKARQYIYLDGAYALSMRSRTFQAMGLFVGMEATLEELQERETHFFKHQYGEAGWAKEKVRLDRVKGYFESCDPAIKVHVNGFGADSTKFIAGHAAVAGEPDLKITDLDGNLITYVEVTGTEILRGDANEFWVCPHKVKWAADHPDLPYTIALHYAQPRERLMFFTPEPGRTYVPEDKVIKGAIEPYVCIGTQDVIGARPFVETFRAMAREVRGGEIDLVM